MTNQTEDRAPRRLDVPRLSAAGCLTALVLAAVTALPGAASATEPRPSAHTGSGHGQATSPYAEPLDAFGGLTLGQYLAARRYADPRL